MTRPEFYTNKDCIAKIGDRELQVPAGVECEFIEGGGGGFALTAKDTLKYGAYSHEVNQYHAYLKKEDVNFVECRLIRGPISDKSTEWKDTAYHWRVNLRGQVFDYYTGSAWVKERPNGTLKPIRPTYDDVVYSLCFDAEACEMSFSNWCGNFGASVDSRESLETYLACQENGDKLYRAGINVAAERERLADY